MTAGLLRWMPVLLLSASGCGSSHEVSVGSVDGGGLPPGADGGPSRELPDTGVVEPPPGPTLCGGETCGPGEECCLETGVCFAPGDGAACRTPPRDTEPAACSSNRDCGSDELCDRGEVNVCFGAVGVCMRRPRAADCDGAAQPVCGCDGRTYRGECFAHAAGVRALRDAACGTVIDPGSGFRCSPGICPMGFTCHVAASRCIPDRAMYACGTDAQCPAGLTCCELAGICVDPGCPECCRVPPPGAEIPCRDDSTCAVLDGYPMSRYVCAGDGCGPGGGCIEPTSCTGELAPVCGCDGVDYTNACWAMRAETRVAHEGGCTP